MEPGVSKRLALNQSCQKDTNSGVENPCILGDLAQDLRRKKSAVFVTSIPLHPNRVCYMTPRRATDRAV